MGRYIMVWFVMVLNYRNKNIPKVIYYTNFPGFDEVDVDLNVDSPRNTKCATIQVLSCTCLEDFYH